MPKRKTWETLGMLDPGREPKFLTELGPSAVHDVWTIAMSNLRLIRGSSGNLSDRLAVISECTLARDVAYLMVGIASETFPYDGGARSFCLRPGACVVGVTPETMASYCARFLEWGSGCRRLEAFCEAGAKMRKGLVYEGFVSGIAKYLQVERRSILKIADTLIANSPFRDTAPPCSAWLRLPRRMPPAAACCTSPRCWQN